MDKLIPEEALRADRGDSRQIRERKLRNMIARVSISKHYVMIGVGFFILLILVLGIGSALKISSRYEASSEDMKDKIGKDLNLPRAQEFAFSKKNVTEGTKNLYTNSSLESKVRMLEKKQVFLPKYETQKSKEDTLSRVIENKTGVKSTFLQKSKKMMRGLETPESMRPIEGGSVNSTALRQPKFPNYKTPTTVSALPPFSDEERISAAAWKAIESGHYTLQLSSASQPHTLRLYAQQQNLKNYLVFSDQRKGAAPWYTLVSGNYKSSDAAKHAIETLPNDVKAKKPWVRYIDKIQDTTKH